MKIAIQGHPTRGKEVIQILESLGGINRCPLSGTTVTNYYYIDYDCRNVIHCHNTHYINNYCKKYTLEEFEKEFPFKIGDKVKHITSICTIRKYCYMNNKPCYEVESVEFGIIATIPIKILEPYKEMEKRNITLTLEKAKEWYKKGGELKEIALQAYSEEELNKVDLPKTWEEFCKNHPKTAGEAFIDTLSIIFCNDTDGLNRGSHRDKNLCPSKKSAEAHLAMIQLEQLRDCWRQGWIPKTHAAIYVIKFSVNGLGVYCFNTRGFLSFPTKEMAEEFLKCFRDLIEQAGDLI